MPPQEKGREAKSNSHNELRKNTTPSITEKLHIREFLFEFFPNQTS